MSSKAPGQAEDKVSAQLDSWRDALISLDRRQRLLYFKHMKTGSLELMMSSARVFAGLHTSKGLEIVPEILSREDREGDPATELRRDRSKLTRGMVCAEGKDRDGLTASARTLFRTATTAFVDRGVWVLYAGLGMATWLDDQKGDPVESPLLLVPVRITLGKGEVGPTLNATDDDCQINPSLVAKLDRDFGIDLSGVDADSPVEEVLAQVKAALPAKAGWGVVDRVVVAGFTFHKEAMYRDLDNNREELLEHELVQLLALGPKSQAFDDVQFEPLPDELLDSRPAPEQMFTILDADGSQRRCIVAALDGKSFVMDGPPGTGKSQTIANIIAELMYHEKSVLFVSEKAAALDVVRNRLADARLDPFILELHSHKANRKAIAETLGSALRERPSASAPFSDTDLRRLAKVRKELSAYAQAMNEVREPLGRSLHDVLGELGPLRDMRDFTLREFDCWLDLSATELAEIESLAGALRLAWDPVELGSAFYWSEVAMSDASAAQVQELRHLAEVCSGRHEDLVYVSATASSDIGLAAPDTTGQVQHLGIILAVLEERPQPGSDFRVREFEDTQARWLADRAELEVQGACERLLAAHGAVDAARGNLGALWSSAPPPDLDTALVLQECGLVASGQSTELGLPARIGLQGARDFLGALEAMQQQIVPLAEASQSLARPFGINSDRVGVARARDLAGLAALASSSDKPETGWFNPGLHRGLAESHRTLEQLVLAVNHNQEELSRLFTGDALELPLAELSERVQANTGFRRLTKQSREDRKALKQVAVRRRVDRQLVALLPTAATWQAADRALHESEPAHAPKAGDYYAGTATDFGRLGRALEAARRSVELARDELNPDLLADQLARTATPDPMLQVQGPKVRTILSQWDDQIVGMFGLDAARELEELPLSGLTDWLTGASSVLREQIPLWQDLEIAEGRHLNAEDVRNIAEASVGFHRTTDSLTRESEAASGLLGCFGTATVEALEAARTSLEWVIRIREVVPDSLDSSQARAFLSPGISAEDLSKSLDQAAESRHELIAKFSPLKQSELNTELDHLASGSLVLEGMVSSADTQLPLWHDYIAARNELDEDGLSEVVEQLVADQAPASDVSRALKFAVLSAWVACIQRDDKRLRTFASRQRDAASVNFQELDGQFVRTRAAGIINKAADGRPKAIGGPAGLIQKQAQLRSRHMPIRDLLAEAKDVALAIKPCFMMSPLAVSQYLPAQMRFDVVIFDEASQVLPEDAANCIYRGRQLIVAGDQNQLPPTDFFQTATVEPSAEDATESIPDDFRSLLDLCKAQGLPSLPLTWHYRSRHEHLIAFSNYKFYGGKLNTFPGASGEAESLGVEAFYAEGMYRRGAQRDNPVEARRVVDRVLFHRHNHPTASIGVVAFSAAQEDAVVTEMESRARTHPELSDLLSSEDRLEGFFVKNLENVQGDERDIIIFTVGYGPDEAGKFTANLGPLTREGGWKRLNVAITRARQRVEIVHSVLPEDFPPGVNLGVQRVREYLDYAIRGPKSLAIDLKDSLGDAESPFEEDVLATIRGWGYDAVPQVGTAGYRLDIGVRDPDHPSGYLMAVECDGAAYHSAKAARDRDRLREQVLTGLGWRIHRIWGLSWYRDRQNQEDRLREALLEARGSTRSDSFARNSGHDITVTTEDFDPLSLPSWAEPYIAPRPVTVDERWKGARGIVAPGSTPALVEYLVQVIRANAPIHIESVRERLRQDWSVGRAGVNVQRAIDSGLEQLLRRNPKISLDDAGFFRLKDRPLEWVRVGLDGGEVRPVGFLPPEELDLALEFAILDAHAIDRDEVVQYVKSLFGWSRLGADIESAMRTSITRLLKQGRVVRAGANGLTYPPQTR